MMRRMELVQKIDSVGARLREASELWNGSDLEKVAAANDVLHAASSELNEVKAAMESGSAEIPESLRTAVAGLQREIGRIGRVVDACTAFHRGRALCSEGGSVSYTALGAAQSEASGLEIQLQG